VIKVGLISQAHPAHADKGFATFPRPRRGRSREGGCGDGGPAPPIHARRHLPPVRARVGADDPAAGRPLMALRGCNTRLASRSHAPDSGAAIRLRYAMFLAFEVTAMGRDIQI
jgi:hypothetical protein